MATRLSDIVRAIPARLRLQGSAARSMETARHRLVVAGLLFSVCFGVVAIRLVDVTLLAEAHEPRAARVPNTGPLDLARADIVDRNGVLLATSLVTQSLYANPKLIGDPDMTARRLASVLPGLEEKAVRDRLASETPQLRVDPPQPHAAPAVRGQPPRRAGPVLPARGTPRLSARHADEPRRGLLRRRTIVGLQASSSRSTSD